jgi:type IV pilus biogenesis protein PilP
MANLPSGFWSWPVKEQLKWLQERKLVLEGVQSNAETFQKIRAANQSQASAVLNTPPVTVRPVEIQSHAASAEPEQPPSIRRIFERNGIAMADLLLSNSTVRTVRAGSQIDKLVVAEITKEDVIVVENNKRFPLQGTSPTPSQQGKTAPSLGSSSSNEPRIIMPPVQAQDGAQANLRAQ